VGLRLLCPFNRKYPCRELRIPESYRFLSLRFGRVNAGMKGGLVEAHIIGAVYNINGDCHCKAWDYDRQEILDFDDNVHNMKYKNIGKLALEVQGIRL